MYDDVTYVFDDVTYVYDDVTYVCALARERLCVRARTRARVYVCVCVCASVCLFLSACLAVSVCLSICLSPPVSVSVCLPVHVCVCMLIYIRYARMCNDWFAERFRQIFSYYRMCPLTTACVLLQIRKMISSDLLLS